MAPGEQPPRRASREFKAFLWVVFAGWVVISFILGGKQVTVGVLLGFVLMPYLIAREHRRPRPWRFSLIGAGACLGFGLLLAGIREIGQPSHIDDLLAALEQVEPETGKQARAGRMDMITLQPLLGAATARAFQRAPDADVVAYDEALFQLIETPAGVNPERCAQKAAGGVNAPLDSSEGRQIAMATIRLFGAATAHAEPVAINHDRANALRASLVNTLDADGVLSDPARYAGLTREQHCDLILREMDYLRQLPLNDRALLLRARVTPPPARHTSY
ncbi:MAG TPA: hypothetical protein VFS58_00200 [Steroidobacteraceae bacterium]|nr:hypothetical protein [Steroidobacteraceae bacterium]